MNMTMQESSFSFLKGIGQNHKRDFQNNKEKQTLKRNAPVVLDQQKDKIQPRIEPEPEDVIEQHREHVPQMVSYNSSIQFFLKFSKQTTLEFNRSNEIFGQQNTFRKTFDLKRKSANGEKLAPETEQDVKYLTVELDGLPSDANAKYIRDKFFKEAHVVKTEQNIDNITGACTGTARVKVRCENGSKSEQILQ